MSRFAVLHILCLLPFFLSLSSTDLNIFHSIHGGANPGFFLYQHSSFSSLPSSLPISGSIFRVQAKTFTVETDNDSGHFGFQKESVSSATHRTRACLFHCVYGLMGRLPIALGDPTPCRYTHYVSHANSSFCLNTGISTRIVNCSYSHVHAYAHSCFP